MTPEQEQKLNEVYEFIQSLKNDASIPFEIDTAFRARFLPSGFRPPLTAVTAPSGGATVDSNARTAINSIITRLEDLGLVEKN